MDIKKILEDTIKNFYLIDQNEIPNIDLYMDQVTTFMDNHLNVRKRNDEDKVLTKTMINNYAKNDLLPSPEKKRYSKEHVLLLTLIYYYKNVMPINDIKKLMAPITEAYFQGKGGKDLTYIYEELLNMEQPIINSAMSDMKEKLNAAMETFSDAPKKDADYLHTFAFVSLLSFDVYFKKQVIEAIIDSLNNPITKEEKEKIQKEKEKAAKKAAIERAKAAERAKAEKRKSSK